jgi:CrcB protein
MMRVLLVLAGGGVGSVLRYLTVLAAVRFVTPSFPVGTLVVNLVGCFFIGFVHTLAMLTARISPDARLFLTTGVMGGLTTYSSFNYEALVLVEQAHIPQAIAYALAMLIGCVAAGLLGTWSAHAIVASG